MRITVNGKERAVEAPVTILGLLESLDLNPRAVVVERNLGIVPRDDYGNVQLADGDRLEVLRLVGGG